MSKTKTKASTIVTPSVLSFSRTIEPTDGFFYQKDSRDETGALKPVLITKRKLKTTMSNRQKDALAKNREKLNDEIIKSNIQETESCYLDDNCDTLVVKTGIKVLPFDGTPNNCNNSEFFKKLQAVVAEYKQANEGFSELATRYATNIANGRWLWRNRMGARTIKITVECIVNDKSETLVFDSKTMAISDVVSGNDDVAKLAGFINAAMNGDVFLSLYLTAELDIGFGHQAFPSEEMNIDKEKKGKELFHRDGIAGYHSVKIGNAIRTIDTWYVSEDSNPTPISVETYGSVPTMGTAFRHPADGFDFYTLFDSWLEKDEQPTLDQQHYVMALLIRGGVLGKSAK
ncbi:type I-F CRISPR-associated protein Csy3 [uncultured Psychrobacter sp.]|uniref:type I-F CRISPR-associated protein Csy3 n=1 Tax=uncultured Psychrobacter sp. TaxID=259303 RepID=UPI0030DA61DB